MAKKAEVQKELELEDTKKTESADETAEVVVDSQEDKKAEEDEVDKKIKDLQDKMAKSDEARKLAEEKADRLEKERADANAKAEKAEGRAASSQKEAIVGALAASEESLVVHRASYKAALESGDSDATVEAQEKLSEAKYLNSELKKNKIAFEQWEKQQEEIAKQPKAPQQTAETKAWIDRNPKFTSDPEFRAEAESAHYVAIQRGIRPDSVAYFEFIDKRLEKMLGAPAEVQKVADSEDDEPPAKKKDPSYSAPPSRGNSNAERDTDSSGKKIYKLTAEQREAAEFMNMTDVQYAQYLEAEKKRK